MSELEMVAAHQASIMGLSLDGRIAEAESRVRAPSRHIVQLLDEGRAARDACAVLAMMLRAREQMHDIRDMLHLFRCHH